MRLDAHIAEEDGYWVPLFEDRFGMSRGFGAELLRSEHRVIEKLLGALRFLVRSVAGRGGEMAAQDVLNLLEESFRFRGVLSHHHAREDNVMIPALRELAARGELPE